MVSQWGWRKLRSQRNNRPAGAAVLGVGLVLAVSSWRVSYGHDTNQISHDASTSTNDAYSLDQEAPRLYLSLVMRDSWPPLRPASCTAYKKSYHTSDEVTDSTTATYYYPDGSPVRRVDDSNADGLVDRHVEWDYDGNGRLLRRVTEVNGVQPSDTFVAELSYDAEGHLVRELGKANGAFDYELEFDYDSIARIAAVYERYDEPVDNRTIYYIYDRDGRLLNEKLVYVTDGAMVSSTDYMWEGDRVIRSDKDLWIDGVIDEVTLFNYDLDGNLVSQLSKDAGGTDAARSIFEYSSGLLVRQLYHVSGTLHDTWTYSYDDHGRLAEWLHSGPYALRGTEVEYFGDCTIGPRSGYTCFHPFFCDLYSFIPQ